MKRVRAFASAVRDSVLVAWLVLGGLVLALVFAVRAGITWRTGIPLLLAAPLAAHLWARAMARLERKSGAGL
jgi:hypothetical protein